MGRFGFSFAGWGISITTVTGMGCSERRYKKQEGFQGGKSLLFSFPGCRRLQSCPVYWTDTVLYWHHPKKIRGVFMNIILAILGLVFYLPLAVILELTKRYM